MKSLCFVPQPGGGFSVEVKGAFAAPPIWESDLGAELGDLTGEDDEVVEVSLSFPFVFEGTPYTDVFVGTNGGIQLGDDGDDDDIDYDMADELDDFYDDGGFPVILPFGTDMDLSSEGTIHFKDFGDRAVFTWNEVGTNQEEEHLSTFQIQLLADGRIIFSYNGILDGPGEDLVDSLDVGILVGISGSTGTDPGASDLSASPSTATDTIYEVWNYEDPPENNLFDLDMNSLCFVPQPGGGFSVEVKEADEAGPASPDLQIGKSFSQLKGDGINNRRKASRKQTLVRPARIFKTNTQRAALLMQNDGGAAANFSLKSSGDRRPRMKVTARSGGRNVSAAVQSGRFSRNVEPGGSVRVLCRVQTNRFYAGVLRNGDRDDTISFRLTGGGGRDNAAMVLKYRGPAGATRL
jgi:hypothetical protein